ncbi:MAG: ribonuclease III [Balneolaceae bacterium]|nr:ribonuclease III [Balneolaceae bacterium]
MLERFRSYFKGGRGESLELDNRKRVEKLERIIGLDAGDPFLYVRALQHRSILADESYSETDSYERLEFLGDAVLDLIVSEIIFERFPDEDEGFLTKLRAKLVRGEALADYAMGLGLNKLMVIGERARGQGIELSKSVLADVFESLVGAIYVDHGYMEAYRFSREVIEREADFDKLIGTLDNYKSMLLEWAQARQLAIPTYQVTDERGPGHDKTFEVKVMVDGEERGTGSGKSKKEAEQHAARHALRLLEGE